PARFDAAADPAAAALGLPDAAVRPSPGRGERGGRKAEQANPRGPPDRGGCPAAALACPELPWAEAPSRPRGGRPRCRLAMGVRQLVHGERPEAPRFARSGLDFHFY